MMIFAFTLFLFPAAFAGGTHDVVIECSQPKVHLLVELDYDDTQDPLGGLENLWGTVTISGEMKDILQARGRADGGVDFWSLDRTRVRSWLNQFNFYENFAEQSSIFKLAFPEKPESSYLVTCQRKK